MAARVAPAHDGIQPPAPRRLAAVAGHLGPRAAAEAAAAPFVPAPLLPGGQVLTLFAPGSPLLNAERVHEPESYNHRGDPIDLAATAAGKTRTAVNVHNPSIEAHILPPGPQNTGSAIIVIPGGGHQILMIGPEGGDCVPFFANYGISTIILRERLRIDGYDMTTDAMDDTYQAIRLVRHHAAEWGLSPHKIGVMGFSAGAELAATAALTYESWDSAHAETPSASGESLAGSSCRPDFVALLYPGPTPFRKGKGPHAKAEDPEPVPPSIPLNVPPSFIASPGSGDKIHAIWATEYFSAMLEAGVPNLEMHIYGAKNADCFVRVTAAVQSGAKALAAQMPGNGTHGGGLTYRHGTPLGSWTDRFIDWIADCGFLDTELPGEETRAALDVASFARGEPVPQS